MKSHVLEEMPLSIDQLIHRWGCPISETVLDSCNYFFTPEIEGFIGYRIAHQTAIVLGDPICASEKKIQLATAFQKYCQDNQLSCIYFIVSQDFAKSAMQLQSKIMIEIGDEIFFNPMIDPTIGHKGVKLRNKIHHAWNEGLVFKEYDSHDPKLEEEMLQLGQTWVKARRGPQIYLGDLNFFENRVGKRWFYLHDKEQKIVAMALLSELEAYEGWLLKFLIASPNAPRGTSELLMVSLLEILRQEECRFLTYGIVPGDHLGEATGLGKFNMFIVKGVFKIAKWIFRLSQRKIYWQQFHPYFKGSYLLFNSSSIGIKEIRALASAMKIDF